MYMRSRSWVSLEIIFMTCYASLLGQFLVWGHCLHLQGWVSESAWCSKLGTSWELFMSGIFWMLFAVQGTSFPAKLLDGVCNKLHKVTFFICSFCNSGFGKTTRKCSSRLRIRSIAFVTLLGNPVTVTVFASWTPLGGKQMSTWN